MTRLADFTTGTYTGITPSCSRASTGYAETVAGALTSFAVNTLRRTNKGLLVEPAATNLLPRSQEYGATGWGGSGWSVTSDVVAAPDGTTTADLLTTTSGGTATRWWQQAVTITAAPHVWSVHVKPKELTFNWFDCYDGSTHYGFFSVAQPSALTQQDAGFTYTNQDLANSWVRLALYRTAASSSGIFDLSPNDAGFSIFSSVNILAGDGQYYWGGQLEAGTVATSYIPTGASSATRAADAVTFTVPVGVDALKFTFDDGSTQDITSGVTPGASYQIPTNLNRAYIKYIDDAAAPTFDPTYADWPIRQPNPKLGMVGGT